MLCGCCGLSFVPLVWSWSLVGLSCWPEPSEEYLATFHHPGPSSGPSGPLAVGLDHYCPPRKPEPYSRRGSTWRRTFISNNRKPEPHSRRGSTWRRRFIHGGGLYLPPVGSHALLSSYIPYCQRRLLVQVQSSHVESNSRRCFHHLEVITNYHRLWHQLFNMILTTSIYLFRGNSPVLSAVWPAK